MIYGTPTVKLRLRFKSIKYHPPPIFHQHMFPNVCPGALSCLVHFKNQVPFLLLKGTQMWCSHELGPRPVKSWPSNANLLQVLVSTLGRLGGQSCRHIILMEWNPKWGKIMHIIIWWYSKCASTNELSGFSMCYLKNCWEIFITNLLIVQKITWKFPTKKKQQKPCK